MSEPTKPIAFRVSHSIDEEIQKIAEANGQSKGDWVRDQVMMALHNLQGDGEQKDNRVSTTDTVAAIESRLDGIQASFREELRAVKAAIADAAKSHHNDLRTVAQVGVTVEESMEQRIDNARLDVLDAIERLKQSQRSHKDTLLQALHQRHETCTAENG